MPDESAAFTVISETRNQRVSVRRWRPGDGLGCTWAKSAPKEAPCGPPVVVSLTDDVCRCGQWGPCRCRSIRRVLCRNHIPGSRELGAVAGEARKAALERLAVEHWEQLQGFIEEETSTRLEERLGALDDDLRAMLLASPDQED